MSQQSEEYPYKTIERAEHASITYLQVTNRTEEQIRKQNKLDALGITQSLAGMVQGKNVLISGGSLSLKSERELAQSAEQIHVLDPSHGLDPDTWTMDSTYTSLTQFDIYFRRRQNYSDQISVGAAMNPVEFRKWQKRRIFQLPQNMTILPLLLPPLPEEVQNVNLIMDTLGPLHYVGQQNEQLGASLVEQYIKALAHHGQILASHIKTEILSAARSSLVNQGIQIDLTVADYKDTVAKGISIVRLS